ncbi:hypothetical protein [Lysinibacillus sp. BPa_S21]|uniref:hypothetical protein n=1 Tax=Lysinibacillus sp. BPa_S21 TaxID=2932478 RepID=UPI00201324A0|nr:hypothetical protein [Lysinibacillus sp. BPa_S21]MCL1696325.1 hypothetical protein [Lysinibacillus sp. BPa_S21]
MTRTTLTVKQIHELGLWEKVCEYKGWDTWILNEGKIEEDELVEFDSEFKKEIKLTEEQELAELLHSKLCTWNHTDGCAWYYHTNDWTERTHKRYLAKANKLLETEVYIEDIKKVIEIISN